MKLTPEQQIEIIQQDIEGMLNDFEGGISEKNKTIVLLRNYIYDRTETALQNYITKQAIQVDEKVIVKLSEYIDNKIVELIGKQSDKTLSSNLYYEYNICIGILEEIKSKFAE